VNPRNYGRERRALLTPLAIRHQLEYDREVVYSGTSREAIAFQAVSCGADLLSGLRYADAVPTPDRKVARSTAKLMAQRFTTETARRASIFLAQALAVWYVEMMSRAGDATSAAVHDRLREIVQEFYPLSGDDLACLNEVRVEYRVMDDQDVAGRIPATGWYMALIDPEFAEGRDPATDEGLIEVQMRFASRYLRLKCELRAIALCVGNESYESIEESLFSPYWPGYEILEYDLADLRWWTHAAALWHECGERALAGGLM